MHALTVKQPYAGDILTGSKPYEFRNFRPTTITEFALHAGATPYLQHDGPYGAILGIVRIVDIVPATQVTSDPAMLAYGKWAWRLEVVEVFEEPIPARGRPGFWKWERPENVESNEPCGWLRHRIEQHSFQTLQATHPNLVSFNK